LLYILKPNFSYDFATTWNLWLSELGIFFFIFDINNLPHASWQDIEQLLNYIGAESLGPRHVLANLKQLTTIIQSQ
jgi:hypothetical protein